MTASVHAPPFPHGLLEHSSISVKLYKKDLSRVRFGNISYFQFNIASMLYTNVIINTVKNTVNTSKSKAMYDSGKIKKKLPVIYYNQEPLDWVEDFQYLGVHIARNGKLTNGLKNVCQQARRAQGTLD